MAVAHLTPRMPRATVRCLQKLLEQANAGRVTGIAFIAMMPNGFIADACGEAHNDPATAREMVAVLDAKLASRIRPK